MAYKIIETELGQKDLSGIVDYIVYSLENPSAAATLLDEVEACYDSLERHPKRRFVKGEFHQAQRLP